jgi:hypothetical protein
MLYEQAGPFSIKPELLGLKQFQVKPERGWNATGNSLFDP